MIKIRDLTKIFKMKNDELVVLNNINLDIEDGDIFGIIGMSGAGKSTLIRCINLLERPTSGYIEIDGVDITTKRGNELLKLRKNIGMIFQNFNLLMQKSVKKNIAFGLEITKLREFKIEGMAEEEWRRLNYFKKKQLKKEAIEKRVNELLKVVDLEEKADVYPSQLSGGQRQRVAIARALATKPSVLLCDEATSALDSMTTKSILNLLKKINEETKVTIIIITHEMNVVQEICNKVAVLDKSEVVETGHTDEVFGNKSSLIVQNLLGGVVNE
ncbi:D-methionine transport system ATP-binding protein [Mobilisporobacter senegalensis]|uniref:D-methionine transport system ATP-binding protein n=1 Tax=Mobilisporobacter senegalensis TaxID=1329262 RepID=A0A3N1XGF9_9FIRM|nr:ATP-binding cassette domain-containing protein [Mobilisporobacter senegalensis]ROR25745.1 D-methionine transport system ATP-binding protein [Mobilisporobacter senegalensis]